MDRNHESIAISERIFVPVSKKCNVQCNFCDRRLDCCNAGKNGESSSVVTEDTVEAYLRDAFNVNENVETIEIVGTGDVFATPQQTIKLLEIIRNTYPEKLLCLTTNGLELADYAEELARLRVAQVSVAVNAVRPIVGAEVYEWVYYKDKSLFGVEAAEVLIEKQKLAVEQLKKHNISVKINTIVIPKVNENHVAEVAEETAKWGADVQDCLPFFPVEGTEFSGLFYSNASALGKAMLKASEYLPQVSPLFASLQGLQSKTEVSFVPDKTEVKKIFEKKPNIAVCTTDGGYVDLHLGATPFLWIYSWENEKVQLVEKRPIHHDVENRWDVLAGSIPDCHYLLVAGVGGAPLKVLDTYEIDTIALEGSIPETLSSIFQGNGVPDEQLKRLGKCGFGTTCSGPGPQI